MKAISNWVKGHLVLVYFVLTCAITWAIWVPSEIISWQHGYVLPSPATQGELVESGFQDTRHVIISVLFTLGGYGPLVAAIITAAIEGGKEGLWELWKRCTQWRVGFPWYLGVLLLPLILISPVVLVVALMGLLPQASAFAAPLLYLSPWFLFELLTSGLEEPGWRGYALPRLQARYGARKATVIIGAIWGIWHWPLFIEVYFQAASDPSTPLIAAAITAIVQAVLYAGGSILSVAFIYTWYCNNTRSVFLTILLHASINTVSTYLHAVLQDPELGFIVGTAKSLMRWAAAIILMRFFWKTQMTQVLRDKTASIGNR